MVLPLTSTWSRPRQRVKLLRSPRSSIWIWVPMEELRQSRSMMAVWATRWELYAGMLHTVMPLALAAARSMLL